ncbi:MAG: ComEA family DNA-binding protein [Myxococcales bacterium]
MAAGENENRGGRARALAALLALTVAWAVWGSRGEEGGSPTTCEHPSAWADQPQRVQCGGESKGKDPPPPLGALRALGAAPDLNRLTAADFATLPGIGAKLAERIVEARRAQGGFRSIDDLASVKGIGPAKLAKLRAALEPPKR